MTGYPLVLVACCVLVLAATGLATYRYWIPAVLLLFAAAAMPWIPAITFLSRLLSLLLPHMARQIRQDVVARLPWC